MTEDNFDYQKEQKQQQQTNGFELFKKRCACCHNINKAQDEIKKGYGPNLGYIMNQNLLVNIYSHFKYGAIKLYCKITDNPINIHNPSFYLSEKNLKWLFLYPNFFITSKYADLHRITHPDDRDAENKKNSIKENNSIPETETN